MSALRRDRCNTPSRLPSAKCGSDGRRKFVRPDCTVDHDGVRQQTALAKIAGHIGGPIRAGEIKERSADGRAVGNDQAHQVVRIAVGRQHLGKPGGAGCRRRAPPDREDRQCTQFATARMQFDRPGRVATGHDDAGPGTRTKIGVRRSLDPQEWCDQHLMTLRAQMRCGLLAFGFGPGDQEPHATHADARHRRVTTPAGIMVRRPSIAPHDPTVLGRIGRTGWVRS